MIFSDRLARKHWSSLTPMAGCSSSRAFNRPLEMHSSSVNSAAVPLRRNTLWERQFSPRKLPGVRYAISSGAERPNGELSDIQQAFMDETAIQCGFCIPGFIMTAAEILDRKVYYTDDQLRKLLSGHLCRCTGYENIFKAVKKTMLRRLGMLDDPFLNT